MGLFENLLYAVVHFVLAGLDVAAFFVAVRALANRFPNGWFVSFARIGEPITTPLLGAVYRMIGVSSVTRQRRCEPIGLLAIFVALAMFRIAIQVVF